MNIDKDTSDTVVDDGINGEVRDTPDSVPRGVVNSTTVISDILPVTMASPTSIKASPMPSHVVVNESTPCVLDIPSPITTIARTISE